MFYKNLEQRMISTYLDTFPAFIPAETVAVSKNSQEQFYSFIKSIYLSTFENQRLLFTELNEDDAYVTYFNKSNDKKPELLKLMKKDIKVIEDILLCLYNLGQESVLEDNTLVMNETFKISKKHLLLLQSFGLYIDCYRINHDTYQDMFVAWKWIATRDGNSIFEFSRCMFNQDYPYASDIMSSLSRNQEAFRQMENYLLSNDYVRKAKFSSCIPLGFTTNNSVTLDYVKKHGETESNPGNFVYDHYYTGLTFEYSIIMQQKLFIGLRILGMKDILNQFDLMSDSLKDFILAHTKRCSMCGYCIFKKWDKRKPLCVLVSHNGMHNLCPIFPGYNYCFNELDDNIVKNIAEFLAFMDRENSVRTPDI